MAEHKAPAPRAITGGTADGRSVSSSSAAAAAGAGGVDSVGAHGGPVADNHNGASPAPTSVWQPAIPRYKPFGCCCWETSSWYIILGVLFVVFALIASLGPIVIHNKIVSGIQDRIIVKSNTSDGYAAWQDSRSIEAGKTQMRGYLWHIANPTEFLAGKAKPYLVQKGPYTYEKIDIKYDIHWINNTFIKFKTWTYYLFNRDLSSADDTELVTSLNIPFQAIRQNADPSALELLYNNLKFDDEKRLFTTRPARDHMWGYIDDEMTTAAALTHQGSGRYVGLQPNMSAPNVNSTDPLNSLQFGDDMIYSGESDESMVQKYYAWRSHTQLAVCNVANCPPSPLVNMWSNLNDSRVPTATMGRQFARDVAHGTCVNTFVPQTFRQFTLCNQNSEEVVVKGVTLLRFTVANETYLNAAEWPDNARWNQNGVSGVCNVSRAQHGMPVFMSKPHFYGAPRSTWAHLDGDIKPNYEAHNTFVHVQPDLGTTMDGRKRIQVNWFISNYTKHTGDKATWFAHVAPQLIPVAWFEESGTASDYLVDKFNNGIVFGKRLVRISLAGGAALAVLCIIAAMYLNYTRKAYVTKYGNIAIVAQPSLNQPLLSVVSQSDAAEQKSVPIYRSTG